MSEANPFAPKKPQAGARAGSSRLPWGVAGVLGVLLIAALLLWAGAVGRMRGLQALPAQVEQLKEQLTQAQADSDDAKSKLAAQQQRIAELEKEKEMAAQMSKGLEDEMRTDLESKDVTISKLQGKLTVSILDRVMFDSGEAVLKPDGEAVMRKIAAVLAEHPKLNIQVVGHTDNVPIRARFASNWELSTARALAAVHFLTEKAGVDPHRVAAVGYGEYRPIADNATAEGRAQNRRIAVVILPEELATADVRSGAATTNAQPQLAIPDGTAPTAQ
ncbi:MAG TPA: OmpA family protein [Dongiaceae bacterium]|jgi:chemotaxis protein MotB|nr:OmpA family protein [Dongiaceae bacterium]